MCDLGQPLCDDVVRWERKGPAEEMEGGREEREKEGVERRMKRRKGGRTLPYTLTTNPRPPPPLFIHLILYWHPLSFSHEL